jgi:hypothetical protein
MANSCAITYHVHRDPIITDFYRTTQWYQFLGALSLYLENFGSEPKIYRFYQVIKIKHF